MTEWRRKRRGTTPHKRYLLPLACRSASIIASSILLSSSSSRVSSSSVIPGSLRNGAGLCDVPATIATVLLVAGEYTCGTCRASPYTISCSSSSSSSRSWYCSNGALASLMPRDIAVRLEDIVVAVGARRGEAPVPGPARPVYGADSTLR